MTDVTYLTSDLKKYYLLDFEQVLLINDPFWGIPESFLRMVLTDINTSENIQSLYSKIKKQHDYEDDESYLVIAYSRSIEAELHKILSQLPSSFPQHTLSIDLMPPSENLNVGPTHHKIGSINNKNYFNLYHFRITFIAEKYKEHQSFWQTIKDLLVNF